ncbi:MAG: hypothetical protein ALAOOOJD_04017 [bacterium]|nr:hypothetical protein [bacterium]
MPLRRTAQAVSREFSPPRVIQIGNSERNFSVNPRHPKRGLAARHFYQWAILLLVTFIASSSWAQSGAITATITPKNDSTGSATMYFVTFEADSGFDRDDKIFLYFPKGKFDILGAFVANNQFNLDGGFIVTQSFTAQNDIIGVERDGHGVDLPPNQQGSFRLAIIGNPTTPGNYTVNLITFRNGVTALNQGQATVTIKAGTLDHFYISTIGNQIAGTNFSFRVTAKDFYNNNTRAFTGNITLSDNTGTLAPASVSLTDTSVNVGAAKITKAQGGVKITASAVVGGKTKTGVSNSFNVNQLKILAIDTAPDKVSRGQTNIEVNMLVQNVGPDAATLTNAQLSFRQTLPNDDNNSYTVNRVTPLSTLPGASVATLKFLVTVKTIATFGAIEISGSVSGNVSGGAISDADADTKDSWTVQTSPALSYQETPGLQPNAVSVGSFYEFKVPIQNSGQATLELKPDSTTITFIDATNDTFRAKLDANAGASLPGNNSTTTLTFRRAQIPINLEIKSYKPQIKLIGTHNGVRYEQTPPIAGNVLTVTEAPQVQIQEVLSSQDTVTQGMTKSWTITLVVSNNTNTNVNLKSTASTELSLIKLGATGSADNTYQISKPVAFKNSGDGRLKAGKTDSLVFQITKTGQATGILAVFAKVFVNELSEPAVSNGTQKSILVQTPAKLSVTLRTSQPRVTTGQTQRWQVIMNAKNEGESALKVVFNADDPDDKTTRTSLTFTAGYTIAPESVDITIPGNASQDIAFNVDNTGAPNANQTISGQVYAQEINTDSLHFANTSGQINVQEKARVSIAAVKLSEVFTVDSVNTGQAFLVQVSVKKDAGTNIETVDSVKVSLNENKGYVTIAPKQLPLTDLNQSLFFRVTARKVAKVSAQLIATIDEAYSANTRDKTVVIGASPNSRVSASIQKPSALRIDSLATSLKSVRFGRTQPPWPFYLFVVNTANSDSGGAVLIDSAKVTVAIAGAAQNDYVIRNLKMPGELNAGQQDTLKYQIEQTGYTGGVATLSVKLFARDKNSNAPVQPAGSTNFTVVSSALVKILRTDFPPAVNRLSGSEIALVDTLQNFQIEVTVENTGLEVIDTAYVALQTAGGSTLMTPQAKALSIVTNGGTAKAVFSVRADNQIEASGETFVARLLRAVTKNGTKALIGPGGDTTAVARIELPARLQLSVSTSDGATSFSRSQQFKVRARIKNLGQAQTDKSGILRMTQPTGYVLVNNDPEKNFAAGDSVEWNLRAPSQESLQQNIKVEITQRPKGKNSGNFANTVNTAAQLTVSTLDNALNITNKSIVAPEGAKDLTLSTDQIFTARVKMSASANLTNRTITLTLPAGTGFRFVNGDSARKNAVGDSVRWQVQAPSIETLRTIKLPVKASAFSNQTETTALDTLIILGVEKQAILQLEPGIKAAGLPSDTVAVNQSFTLVAKLRNTGRALANGTAKVNVTLPPNLIALEQPFVPEKSVDFDQQNGVREITWQVKAAGQPASLNQIAFAITQRPRDVNTGVDVLTSNDPAQFDIAIVATGTVSASPPFIAAPDGARDFTLSTGQEFTVSDTLRWNNAANLVAELVLSPNQNFTITNRIQNIPNPRTSDEVEVSWIVRAPATPIANIDCRVLVKATDSHNTAFALEGTSAAQQLHVVQRAELALSAAITEPASAASGVVSVGQPFRVVATISNSGTASVEDSAKVLLSLPPGAGYTLVDSQDRLLKAVRITEQNTLSWWVRARADVSDLADLLKFNLIQPPRDVNTNAFAAVSDGETELAMRAEGRTLTVENLNQGGGPAVQGGQNFLLARLKLTNPARAGSSNLMLKQLSFDLLNRAGNALVPNAVFKAVRVVWRTNVCGERNTALDATNPLTINLTTAVSVSPDKPDTIAIYADLAENMTDQNFRLVFDNSQDFSVDDQAGGNGVVVETPEGKRFEKFRLETGLAALHGADGASSFFNYPNPLQPGNDLSVGEGTRFNLPEGVAGELKIFTLLGELVWEVKIAAGDQGVFWNGHNGAGQRVLNGVYVAMLKPTNGKMLTTKVAVLRK